MISPDPVTQAPENGQNYNRYSYAYNNPLKYTDPSGYQSEGGGGCLAAATSGGAQGAVGCAVSIGISYVVGKIFGGNSCDRTCKDRNTAYEWCSGHSACREQLDAIANGKPRVASVALFQSEVTARIGDSLRGDTPVSDGEVVGITSPNFPGFKLEDIFLTEKETLKVLKFFFPDHDQLKKSDITIEDKAFAQYLLLGGIEWTATGIGGLIDLADRAAGGAFKTMGGKLAKSTVAQSVTDASVRAIQKGRVAYWVARAYGAVYSQSYQDRLNPDIGQYNRSFVIYE